MLKFFAALPPCLVGMEACGGAHHWARELQGLGHDVRLVAPQFVKPYVKGSKNDANDAEAICEAVSRPHVRFVAVKTVVQQDLQAVHRIRSELVKQRTAKANQIRGLLAEYGVVVGRRVETLRRALPEILEDAGNGLSGGFRGLLEELRQDLVYLDKRVAIMDKRLSTLANTDETAKRLQAIPGIGPVTATALVSVGDGKGFRRGRDGGMAGLGAQAAQQRGQGQAVGAEQARRRLLAHLADPRCPVCAQGGGQQGRPEEPVAAGAVCQAEQEHRRRRPRQQECAGGLGVA